MFSKNTIIALLVVVALAAVGILFSFLMRNNAPVPLLPTTRSGELTRELAKQIITDFYAPGGQYENIKMKDIIVTVTGITMESPTKALVNVGFILPDYSTEKQSSIVVFRLYDDGWRMAQ